MKRRHAITYAITLLFSSSSYAQSGNSSDDKWDTIIGQLHIESSVTHTTTMPVTAPDSQPRKSYSSNNVSSNVNRASTPGNSTHNYKTEIIDIRSLTRPTKYVPPDVLPPSYIKLPNRPAGLTIKTLYAGESLDGEEMEKLLVKMNVRDTSHTSYLMTLLSNKGQDGWEWEQKQRKQTVNDDTRAVTVTELILKKPHTKQ